MALHLDDIDSAFHSIEIKDAGGDSLAIAADGSIAVTDNGGSLTVDGTVELGATSLAALENITAVIDPASLAALESITVQNGAGGSSQFNRLKSGKSSSSQLYSSINSNIF